MTRRFFNRRERTELFVAADGHCTSCDEPLPAGWHADHVIPHSKGGLTDVTNGAALCPKCNLQKGDTMPFTPRPMQTAALTKWTALQPSRFLVDACPGAGKTDTALLIACAALDAGLIDRLIIVVPQQARADHYIDDAHRHGWSLKAAANSDGFAGYDGYITTYQSVNSHPDYHATNTTDKTMVVFDEIHHSSAVEQSWGRSLETAFGQAPYTITLTGTPFRTDETKISFLNYDEHGRVITDVRYGYADAITDGVCRPTTFKFRTGTAEWTRGDLRYNATLAPELEDDLRADTLRVAYDINFRWAQGSLAQGVEQNDRNRIAKPDSALLVLCDTVSECAAVARHLTPLLGETPVVVTNETPNAAHVITQFRNGQRKCIVAVKMVSEGIDIPRLTVCVWLTRTSTRMFFVQAIGRLIRRQDNDNGVNATVFLPDVEPFRTYAAEIEDEIRQAVTDPETERASRDVTPTDRTYVPFTPEDASDPQLATSILRGDHISPDELMKAELTNAKAGVDIEPELTAKILRAANTGTVPDDPVTALTQQFTGSTVVTVKPRKTDTMPLARRADHDRKRRTKLVRDLAQDVASKKLWKTGEVQECINIQLKVLCGGKTVAELSPEELRDQVDLLEEWSRLEANGASYWRVEFRKYVKNIRSKARA